MEEEINPEAAAAAAHTRAAATKRLHLFKEETKKLAFGSLAAVNQRAAPGWLLRPPLEASPSQSFVIENKLKDKFISFLLSGGGTQHSFLQVTSKTLESAGHKFTRYKTEEANLKFSFD